jgi:hypothetical protein
MALIDAKEFWDMYFGDVFLILERTRSEYRGRIFAQPEKASILGGLFAVNPEIEVIATMAELRDYAYADDGRFGLSRQMSLPVGEAIEQIIQKTYPYRDPPPFGKRRMSELFSDVKREFVQRAPSLPALEAMVQNKVDDYTDEKIQPLAALAWFLGQRREISSSKALLAIVRNADFVPYARRFIHFTAVDAAFSSLWKVNDKFVLFELLELMHEMPAEGWRKLAPLFSRLLSSGQLLSMEQCGSDYFRPEYWGRLLQPRRNFSATDWHRFDADSLFWEIRYLSALRLPTHDADSLRKLAGDEVSVVRDLALARMRGG